MFINDEDYRVVIGESALKVVSQTSPENRHNAESSAIEEIASYLRPTYNTAQVFAGEGDRRNKLIVMYTCDIAIYHMVSSQPQKMGSDIRKERYERAIKWLEGVQAGKIIPDLPLSLNEQGEPSGSGLKWQSQKPLRHNW